MDTSRYNIVSGDSNRKYGPYTLTEIEVLLASREVSAKTWCIRVGDGEMVSVGELFPGRSDRPAENQEEEQQEPVHADRAFSDEADDNEWEEESEEDEEDDTLDQIPWEDGIWYADDEEDADDRDEDEDGVPDSMVNPGPRIDSDETIIHMHPSIFGYPRVLAVAFFFVSIGIGAGFLSGYVQLAEPLRLVAWVMVLIGSAIFVLLLITRSFDNFYVTRSRAEVVRGVIAKSSNEVRISDVRRIDVDKNGVLGLLNVGDVKLSSAGTGGFDVVFRNVRGAHRIKKIIRRVQKNPRSSKRYLVSGPRLWRR